MRNTLFIVLLAGLGFTSCTKGGEPEGVTGDTYTASAALDGAQVVPATANDTTRGTFTGWYDEATNNLSFSLNYRKDTTLFKKDTLVRISMYREKPVAAGAPASRNFTFTLNSDATTKPNPTNVAATLKYGLAGHTQFTEAEKQAFLAGTWYVFLHSRKFPNGLIGGRISVTKN